jgi:hypothetical protein
MPTSPGPHALRPSDSLVQSFGRDAYWVGPFEDTITELGIRAALWEVEENDGGNRADLMLLDWEAIGCGRFGQAGPGVRMSLDEEQKMFGVKCSCGWRAFWFGDDSPQRALALLNSHMPECSDPPFDCHLVREPAK